MADLVLASWIAVGGAGVETPEAYTLPGRGRAAPDRAAARCGPVRRRGPREGAAVGVALVPSALVVVAEPTALRLVLVVAAAAAVTVAGTLLHRQAPFVIGAGDLLLVVTVGRLAPYAPLLPRWVTLGTAGLLLLVVGRHLRAPAAAGPRGRRLGRADALTGCRCAARSPYGGSASGERKGAVMSESVARRRSRRCPTAPGRRRSCSASAPCCWSAPGPRVASVYGGVAARLLLLALAAAATWFSLRAARSRLRSSEEVLAAVRGRARARRHRPGRPRRSTATR